jgi:asparagine synthase (glutamine-hydrolysing)
MCGIAGLIQPLSNENNKDCLSHMVSSLGHRGPDGQGVWTTDIGRYKLSLGHTRLAILDLSDAAKQPMIDPESGCVLVYNGEIYNFAELRSELLNSGERPFFSTGDSEVLLRAYVHWGISFTKKLRGMFAFAIYDPRLRRLLLARDPLGIKPLYAIEGLGGRFAFASEVRALLRVPWVQRSLDPIGLVSYLAYGSVQDPYTLIAGVRSIPAGHTIVVDLSRDQLVISEPEPFWEPPDIEQRDKLSRADIVRHVRNTLAESVRLHLVSDVPIGVFLSGGIDSSSLVALMAEVSPSQTHTLTVSFKEAAFDESKIARSVAKRYGTQHTEVHLSSVDFLRDLPRWLESLDQPSCDGANAWVISKACKNAGIKVALSGLGGDELFAGYSTFFRVRRAAGISKYINWLPYAVRSSLSNVIRKFGSDSIPVMKLSEWIHSEGSNISTYLILRRMFLPSVCHELLNPQVVNLVDETALNPAVMNDLRFQSLNKDVITAVSLFEIKTYLANTLLRDSDQMGMAHSIEIRVPFLDKSLVELVLSLPEAIHLKGSGPKPLLESAMRDKINRTWFDRPKMGFTFPFDEWFRGPLRTEIENGLAELSNFPFQPKAVQNLWQKFLNHSGQVNSGRIMTLYALSHWIKQHKLSGEF